MPLSRCEVGDVFLLLEWVRPFEPEVLRIAEACEGVSLAGVCKVSVSFVRNPLDKEVLHAKFNAESRLRDAGQSEPELPF